MFGDSTIKPGDLAVVVRDCCGHYLGFVFRVDAVHHISLPHWFVCTICKREYSNIDYATTGSTTIGTLGNLAMHWLKKIDPPGLLEHEEREEEITA